MNNCPNLRARLAAGDLLFAVRKIFALLFCGRSDPRSAAASLPREPSDCRRIALVHGLKPSLPHSFGPFPGVALVIALMEVAVAHPAKGGTAGRNA